MQNAIHQILFFLSLFGGGAPEQVSMPSAAASVAKGENMQCKRGAVTIGLCGNPGDLYQSCGAEFKKACSEAGGSTSSCGPDGGACAGTIWCQDGSPFYHDCDEKFMTECESKEHGGEFTCTLDCDDGTCCGGKCTKSD